ncbi:hypothetical protein DFH06DRAFT_1220828 [Mycena polygramma]|nr:hypothetical protein DFH06DRAFT_1220828 [Mycena polygramma]
MWMGLGTCMCVEGMSVGMRMRRRLCMRYPRSRDTSCVSGLVSYAAGAGLRGWAAGMLRIRPATALGMRIRVWLTLRVVCSCNVLDACLFVDVRRTLRRLGADGAGDDVFVRSRLDLFAMDRRFVFLHGNLFRPGFLLCAGAFSVRVGCFVGAVPRFCEGRGWRLTCGWRTTYMRSFFLRSCRAIPPLFSSFTLSIPTIRSLTLPNR